MIFEDVKVNIVDAYDNEIDPNNLPPKPEPNPYAGFSIRELRRERRRLRRLRWLNRRRPRQGKRDLKVGTEELEKISEEDERLREEASAEDEALCRLNNAIGEEDHQRWIKAETQRRELMGDDQRDGFDGFIEGWSGGRR